MLTIQEIKQLVDENRTEEAIKALDAMIVQNPTCAECYFLRGNAYRKHNDWKMALSDYCKAMELDPESPAKAAYNATIEILDFYNKDLYNP